ncbi:hypothetical protein PHMEG_000404 [Phytophthora megakarya]|uniref:Uncharacterized protein n=1 Tax=Phytophthora megakarya TaxID=4795 RepID=A0A225X3L7_9STRA|nr:hypothetical protein PHMEG_000404 [Phytophthora megakarya]
MAQDGSNLFQIRRIFGLPSSDGSLPALKIASMAVHTLEKKQLLALAVTEQVPKTIPDPKGDSASSVFTAPADARRNFLLLRTVEEDQRARFWRFPVCSTPKQQKAGKAERLSALEFSPEGDWVAALSQRKNRLHLVPVLTLVAKQRRAMLDASFQPTHHRELMSVNPAAMTTQMASYLRATNEYGGLNGARYHSQVAGDDEQMSTLEFAPGIGCITCVRWWRSLNGKNYCLVGGTESLISIVNVEENAEECRCELVDAVKTKTDDIDDKEKEAGGTGVRYYRVILEKKFQQRPKAYPRKGKEKQEESTGVTSTLKIATTTGASSSSSETNFTTINTAGGSSSPFSFAKAPKFVVKTFPQHFLEDLDFRPQRIKKNSPQVCLYPINGMLSSESSLALYDCKKRKANLYSNFHWRLKGEYEVPDLLPLSLANTEQQDGSDRSESSDTSEQQEEVEASNSDKKNEVLDVELTYCSTDLMLLQGRLTKSNETISTWVSLPSNQGMDEDVVKAHIVHYLSLHGNEKIERVEQSTSRGGASGNVGGSQTGEAEIIYILQTKHHVYECRPQWSRLALFKALCTQNIALYDALSIGYALGIDMASLCQVVANTLYTNVLDGSTTADPQLLQWVRELFQVSRVIPSSAVEQLTAMGGIQNAIDYAQHVLSKPVRDAVFDGSERRRVALLLVDLVLQQQLQKDTSPNTDALSGHEKQDQEREAWLMQFLETNRDYMTTDIVDLCLSQLHVDKAILVATRRDEVSQVLEKIVDEELFLTFLLYLNSRAHSHNQTPHDEAENGDKYSQAKLEILLKDLAAQYRPPIMVSRCVDYENWTAAACIYEAHGELVEALECRLHSHNSRNSQEQSSPTPENTVNRLRQHSNDSVGSAMSEESDFQEQMREELLQLLNSLVVQSHSSEVISEQIRAAILARILVKWFEYGLKHTVLEVFLIDPNVFKHVSPLLAKIFFFATVSSILGPDSVGPSTSKTSRVSQGFDDRDKEWVYKCQLLPFSGQFLFRVCVSFLERDHESSESPTLKLLELVKTNVIENDLSHGMVPISPHSAQALGKTDPLETHVKAFTCGHLFPKRVFEEEVVPEFEKRMNALPMPLFATKQAFTREFKRGVSETPCPVCSFNKISQVVFEQYKTIQRMERMNGGANNALTSESPLQARHRQQLQNQQKPKMPYFFLHREASERLGYSGDVQNTKAQKHEAWEWSEHRTS